MQIFHLSSFPIEQERSLAGAEGRLTQLFATLDFPIRLLAFSRAFDIRPAIARLNRNQRELNELSRITKSLTSEIDRFLNDDEDADPNKIVQAMPADALGLLLDLFSNEISVQQLLLQDESISDADATVLWGSLADAIDSILWRLPWMKEQGRFFEELQRRHLRSSTYIVITWEPPDMSPEALVSLLRMATDMRPVRILQQLPSFLSGPYLLQSSNLRPEGERAPWLVGALSYEIQGVLDATTLHPLLSEKYDVALAIDIVTLSKERAQRTAELAYNASRLLAVDMKVLDTRARGVRDSATTVLERLKYESLHTVQMALLVTGATEKEAESNYTAITKKLGTSVKWFRPPFQQGEILKFFSTAPRGQIEAPLRPRSALSHGVGCLAGILGFHRSDNTAGVFAGIDAIRRAALIFDLFAGKHAAHISMFGMPGFGKTFLLNLLTLRAAVTLGYRVIGIDDFDNGPRMEQAAGAGGACYMLSMETPINIMDIVYDEDADGGWLPNQVQHVIAEIGYLLGRAGKTAEGNEFLTPYDFSPEESGILDRALTRLYRPLSPNTPLNEMPLLSDLITILESFREPEARNLARKLRIKLFGTDDPAEAEVTTVGYCFNTHTQVDWRFGADITYYNTQAVPEIWRPFFYLQIIGAILRFMRANRDQERKTILAIDEFAHVTRVEALARLAAMITKVARKYGIGLIVIDQNPLTLLESKSGRYIYENCPVKITARLDEKPARQLAEATREINEEHIEAVTKFDRGQFLVIVRNDVYIMNAEASPREVEVLG